MTILLDIVTVTSHKQLFKAIFHYLQSMNLFGTGIRLLSYFFSGLYTVLDVMGTCVSCSIVAATNNQLVYIEIN